MSSTYTAGKAKHLILKGELLSGSEVTGSLNLRGTQITALPDNLTVHCSLDLSGCEQIKCPSPWWTEFSETTKRRCIAVSDYALIQTETGKFIAGCRGPWTKQRALKHWGDRPDARAKTFVAAINAASEHATDIKEQG
jgi:hypothetical protein